MGPASRRDLQAWTSGMWAVVAASLVPLGVGGQALEAPDLTEFWGATSRGARAEAAARVLDTHASFPAVLAALRSGPEYRSDVPTGLREMERRNADGTLHRYFIVVPPSYDPTRRYPVRVYLHGGVSRPAPGPGGDWWRRWERLAREDGIAVFPSSWDESLWWEASQVENLNAILDDVKRSYNVDENRVSLFGISDGGTGAYFMAFKDATPWAAFLPFIGHAAVLLNPRVGADGEMHPVNLINSSFFVVNGESDRLYPVRNVRPWIDAFRAAGVDVVFKAKPTGHDVSWWPDEARAIDAFLEARPRDPQPPEIAWAVEPGSPYTRVRWLVVEELDPGGGGSPVPEGLTDSGTAGVVWATRSDNSLTLETNQVHRVRLLISPDAFDLSRPVTVVANGKRIFDAIVQPDPAVLLKWAAVDRDRTMLYAAELVLDVAPGPSLR